MSANTKIEWAHHTFNPWIGCTKVSPACDHCYAEADFDKRRKVVQWGAGQPRKRTAPSTWEHPPKWNREAERLGIRYRVFCASLADVFDNEVPQLWRTSLFGLIHDTPHLDWLLLTKRIGNAARMLVEDAPEGIDMGALPNVWIGATICNQKEADRDIPKLLAVPAAKRFLSMEPLLGPVNLETIHNTDLGEGQPYLHPLIGRVSDGHGDGCNVPQIDWVIVGGESGHGARPMHPNWARSLRDQCQAAGVPFLFKQWGEFLPASADESDPVVADVPDSRLFWSDGSKWDRYDGQRAGVDLVARVGKKAAGRMLDGREWNEVPA